jgi:hypothetical protein
VEENEMGSIWRVSLVFGLFSAGLAVRGAFADDSDLSQQNLVKQANAPISSILQVRLQNSYEPEFSDVHGNGNVFSIAVTMPFPKHRLLPLPQLSMVSFPATVTLPGGKTGSGDLKLVDIALLHTGESVVWGIGPTFVFPVSSRPETGQGKWQAGPAAALAFFPNKWLLGMLIQNPISFAGDSNRRDVSYMIVQPFLTYQFDHGWFVRSQPQILFNWRNGKQVVPLDLGAGRVFKIGRQSVNCFIEPFWNLSHDGPAPSYGITLGISFLYPNFWQGESSTH